SLGVVCYEALVGRPPFRGINELAVMKAADRGEFVALRDALPGVPPALAAVVERAMARQPGQRFADAVEFAQALRGVRQTGFVPSTAPSLEAGGANGAEQS